MTTFDFSPEDAALFTRALLRLFEITAEMRQDLAELRDDNDQMSGAVLNALDAVRDVQEVLTIHLLTDMDMCVEDPEGGDDA